MLKENEHVVIIGNGISGVTCARNLRKKSNCRITIISGETDHFFSRTALMYIYMGHMTYEHTKPYEDWFWKKNRIELKRAFVQDLYFDSKSLMFSDKTSLNYDKLVIATGSASNKFGWPGQDLKGVQGMYSFQDLELLEENSKDLDQAVIVGGGLIGIEMAEMLLSRGKTVTFLVMEECFWGNVLPQEEGRLVSKHIKEHHIDLKLKTQLKEIRSDENGRVKEILTDQDEIIPCQFVGLTVGVHPNIEFMQSSGLSLDRGVLVDRKFNTNIQDVFAIGDCVQFIDPLPGRRPIEQVWYTGRMHAEVLADNLIGGDRLYNPGPWFNSAKFLDIEYQTYGLVLNELSENQNKFYWEHENGKICLKVIWNNITKELVGVNAFGMRLRHELMDEWLRKGRTVDYFFKNLKKVNFDSEFNKSFNQSIILAFTELRVNENKHKTI